MRARSATVLAVALAACTDATAPAASPELVGRWAAEPEALGAGASSQHTMEFTARGRFVAGWRTTGGYPGVGPDDVSSYGRTVGRYRTEGDRLAVTVDSVVTWDRFYGANSPERVEAPPRGGTFPDSDPRFAVAGDVLTLRYWSYPADAPVPTVAVYRRTR